MEVVSSVAGRPLVGTPGEGAGTGVARRSYVALGVGLAVVAVFVAVRNADAGPWVYLVGAVYGSALSIYGALRVPRAQRRSWIAFAVSQVLFLMADGVWTLCHTCLHIEPSPSPADALYLAMYPALALGMWWLVRGRRAGRDRAAFLDAAIITTGVTVIGVVFFIAPAAESSGTSLLGQVVAAAYPVGDLLLVAIAVRLLTSGRLHNVALWAILGSVATVLVVDVYYDLAVINGSPYPIWIECGYLLSYVLLGFAPLHPTARALFEPAPDRSDRITVTRVSLLGVAIVLAPVTGLVAHVTGFRHAPWAVFAGGSVSALLVVLRLWDLVQDLQRQAVQLAALARRDGLTGVGNRRTWDHELSRACAFAREHDAPLTVAVLDMDHFKDFNDANGHLAGDLVLKETATAWASILQDRGFLARYGGEEFTALLPQLTAQEAQPVLGRMRRAVTHDQSCSLGVATWDGVEDPADLMARADQALYQAKRSGRDRIAVHHDGLATVVRPSHASPALASLRVVYQPIVDLDTGEMVGVEALSRFDGQDPRAVFDAAARDGMGPDLEAAAITAALAGWSGRGLLAVNVSLSALATETVQAVLPADLTGVTLEITEADLVNYAPDVMLALDDARARGAQIAIDDFGIGFSNVHRIAKIHPDIIKLDISLIHGIDTDWNLQAVATSCVLFAKLTGARVVAEGIETAGERASATRLGVHLGQGYLLGRPGPLPSALSADTVGKPQQ